MTDLIKILVRQEFRSDFPLCDGGLFVEISRNFCQILKVCDKINVKSEPDSCYTEEPRSRIDGIFGGLYMFL